MAKKAYIGKYGTYPSYDNIQLNSWALITQYFTIDQNYNFTFEWGLSNNGEFRSNNGNGNGYYEEESYDEEADEWYTDTFCEDAVIGLVAKTKMDNVYFDWSVSSEVEYDYLDIYITQGNSSVVTVYVNEASGNQDGTIGPISLVQGQRITAYYRKDGSVDEGDDVAVISNFRIHAYVGETTMSAAVPVTNIYVGDERNIARTIIKAYVGDNNNKARLFWNPGIKYYGTTPQPLRGYHSWMGSAGNSDFAFFGGGRRYKAGTTSSWSFTDLVEAYDKSLIRHSLPDLRKECGELAAETLGDYVVFAGGTNENYTYNDVHWYNKNFTSIIPKAFLKQSVAALASATINNYVVFGGGQYDSSNMTSPTQYNTVTAFTVDQTNAGTITSLSSARADLAATATTSFIFFGGGYRNSTPAGDQTTVDVYSSDLSLWATPLAFSKASSGHAAASTKRYAMFLGGYSHICEIFDNDLTLIQHSLSTMASSACAACSLNNSVLVTAGAAVGSPDSPPYMEIYSDTLTYTLSTQLSEPRWALGAASIGNKYALFAGGFFFDARTANTHPQVVDVWEAS